MQNTLIKNARIVNEGKVTESDVLIKGQRIEKIARSIKANPTDHIVDARGLYLLPGMIDDQVHFREPGLTHKGNIFSESRAAVAGGITSFMEMPNVSPSTTTIEALEHKFGLAKQNSFANYSFYLGATEDNLDEIKQLDPTRHCGVKVFMGASTGDLLVEHPEALDKIFDQSPTLIVTHCESSPLIAENQKRLLETKSELEIEDHPIIRDAEACFASSSYAVELAKKYQSQLHVLHITTEKELSLFEAGPIENKHITAEACVHHLWFSEQDYPWLGNRIKCNPAIKSVQDRDALLDAVKNDRIDIIATDHAPHTFEEKNQAYPNAPAGMPLVQHALSSLLEHTKQKRLTLAQVVQKSAHNPAIRYGIKERGFIREGYFADLVLADLDKPQTITDQNSLYKCAWTPFDGQTFSASITATWVNGFMAFDGNSVAHQPNQAMSLKFQPSR